MPDLTALIAYFSRELDQNIDSADPRTQLDELLRVRPPAPIPVEIVSLLHAHLTEEAATRQVVDIGDIPPLDNEYPGLGPLGSVRLWQGDITTCRADAIVNSATPGMLGCFAPWHDCIDHAIHRGAGPGLRAECATIMRSTRVERPGAAKTTAGYHLPARHVIHTVTPRFGTQAVGRSELKLLASSYRRCLDAAVRVGDTSVVLPTLGGSQGTLSPAVSAEVVLTTVSTWLAENSGMTIVLNTYSGAFTAAYRNAISARAVSTIRD